MKILYSWGHRSEWVSSIERDVAEWRKAGHEVTSVANCAHLGITTGSLNADELDSMYRQRHPGLMRLYRLVEKLSDEYDILISHGPIYHPEFLASLKGRIYRVLYSSDDPDSSESCSKPYVSSFDHCFASSVRFDDITTVTQKFLEWGAKRADWWPYGARPDSYDPSLTEDQIRTEARRTSLIFIGAASTRVDRILQVRRHFGRRFKVYGNWGRLFPLKHGMWVRPVSLDGVARMYRDTKLGFNLHLTFGPCNMRLYELPANGVMQVCDCANGLAEVFEIGKEVVAYDSIEDAIEKIEYYLAHDEERTEIAVNGFRRVMTSYTRVKTFAQSLEKIRQGMQAEGYRIKGEQRIDTLAARA
jgi:spore maturation protein CgeB